MRNCLFYLLILAVVSCTDTKDIEPPITEGFSLKTTIGIDFSNDLIETEALNPYTYRNFYNGAGIAAGDINNDGLIDLYFGGNQVDNKLYLNKGNWEFEDITFTAGVACEDIWSSGVSFVDINHDGLLDIYVCKAGPPSDQSNRHNELFINNGDLTFTERSKEFGLDFVGLAVQANFFDFDRDGDLDCYLLNNSIKTVGAFDFVEGQRNISTSSGNKLLRNDNDKFVDVTDASGIYSSAIGFGLGITVSDLNSDGWPDIFISNDFFEKDYLYINQQNGTFEESVETQIASLSMGSMGADAADLNNDSYPDIMVTEMLPKTIERQRTKTIFESWNKYDLAVNKGYHHQFSRNALHRNMGHGKFMEISRFSGVAATEWSWASLIFDADNDGYKDIFVSNGIYKDLLDRDYLTYMANEDRIREMMKTETEIMNKLVDLMPSGAVSNVMFKNKGNFQFEEVSELWGLNTPSFSNGSAYADLDNDGDLDLVVNNVNMPAFIYENQLGADTNSLTINLNGLGNNTFAVGAKLEVYYSENRYSVLENYPSRGFQSSVPYRMVIGVDAAEIVDSLIITWPNFERQVHKNLKTNQAYVFSQQDSLAKATIPIQDSLVSNLTLNEQPLFRYIHKENTANDFNREQLLPEMHNNEGPTIAKADLNNDGVMDFYIGGAKAQIGSLFLSNKNGFYDTLTEPFKYDTKSEDTDAVFFDSDNDGDLDLYVCSGGKAYSKFDYALNDRLYINDGRHNFVLSRNSLKFEAPISSSTVSIYDYDQDGDPDIFIGERFKVETYGLPGSGYLFNNKGNNEYESVQQQDLASIGMITDSEWADINGDSVKDLIICGEWMPVSIFINEQGNFKNRTSTYGMQSTSGFWKSLAVSDLDNDGDLDLAVGNKGTNTFFRNGTRMYISDFDTNGAKEQIICHKINGQYYPILDRDELISQMPLLKRKLLFYKNYQQATMDSLFNSSLLKKALVLDIDIVETSLFINNGGAFKRGSLPTEVQYSNVDALMVYDINNDGYLDVVMGGNQYLVKPQFGRQDASRGWIVYGSNTGEFKTVESMGIDGQIRGFEIFQRDGQHYLIAAMNNADLRIFLVGLPTNKNIFSE